MTEHSDLIEAIRRFVADPGAAELDELAREAFAFQVERSAPIRTLAAARGVDARRMTSWREIPPVPALAFKSVDLLPAGVDPERALTFRSSGTTAERRSVHRHPFPALYRATIDAAFPGRCLPERPAGHPVPMLSLIPSPVEVPDSSLSFMVGHAIGRWGAAESTYALGPAGLDAEGAVAWVRERSLSPENGPCLVLTTAFALAAWLDHLETVDTRLRLPRGSVVFETGGFKGRRRELTRAELVGRAETYLGVPPDRVVREYGMTELTSQLYTRALDGGDPDLFVPPHWVRVRVLDPETLEEARPGEVGLIAVFDLANLGSALHLLTEDLGVIEEGGLRLLGRARGAELRGCSLTAEEMVQHT